MQNIKLVLSHLALYNGVQPDKTDEEVICSQFPEEQIAFMQKFIKSLSEDQLEMVIEISHPDNLVNKFMSKSIAYIQSKK